MIRCSKHYILKDLNTGKSKVYFDFLSEYRRVSCILVDTIWHNGYENFDVKKEKLQLPKYINYRDFNIETKLSARALSSLVTQIASIISGAVEKRRRVLYIREKLITEGKSTAHLKKALFKYRIFKPDCSKINPELSSKNIEYHFKQSGIELFLKLKCTGFKTIFIPIRLHKQYKKWNSKGKLLGGISLSDKNISLRFEIGMKKKDEGIVLGADQGIKDVFTLSNGFTPTKIDKHNHSLESILEKISRKKRGSKKYKKAQEHRKNFINWSINQIGFNNIKEIRLEEIVNINYKKRVNKKLRAFTNTIIRDKLIRLGEEHGVHVTLQSSTYRSQRCSCCGNVRKSNRKGKIYECKNCGNTLDSDLNAARNHEVDLPPLPDDIRFKKLNLGNGFFWNPEGITFQKEEYGVPLTKNRN